MVVTRGNNRHRYKEQGGPRGRPGGLGNRETYKNIPQLMEAIWSEVECSDSILWIVLVKGVAVFILERVIAIGDD